MLTTCPTKKSFKFSGRVCHLICKYFLFTCDTKIINNCMGSYSVQIIVFLLAGPWLLQDGKYLIQSQPIHEPHLFLPHNQDLMNKKIHDRIYTKAESKAKEYY